MAFVSNGGWIDGSTHDGMRLSLADDHSAIYVYNLRGNMRKSNWKRRRQPDFRAGSQATIAVFIGVKDPAHTGPAGLLPRHSDYLSREEKLRIVNNSQLEVHDWQIITPNAHGNGVNQRNDSSSTWLVIADKKAGHVLRLSSLPTRWVSQPVEMHGATTHPRID